jgi:hypothetical protein
MVSSIDNGISEISDGTDNNIYSTLSFIFSKYGQVFTHCLIPSIFGALRVQIAIFIIINY